MSCDRVTAITNLVASAIYTTTKPNNTQGSLGNVRSNNFNAFVGVNTQFTPKTSGSVGLSYFAFDTPAGTGTLGNQSTLSLYASISHTF